ncbi:unnamed protein product [Ciceribacter sp. T2.26MG-112.2]|nr:unnamed protein product [Ciceribacter naphthalenivorans]
MVHCVDVKTTDPGSEDPATSGSGLQTFFIGQVDMPKSE